MKEGDCKHFTGIQNKTCKAGISYRELCGGENLGWAVRIPCFARFSVPPTVLCHKKIAVTKEDEAAMATVRARTIASKARLGEGAHEVVEEKGGHRK